MIAPVIHLASVSRVYDTGRLQVAALRGVDLEVMPGEFLAIIGPSGSGKSTLMNVLGCLDRPTSGTYTLAGTDVAGLDDDGLARLRSRSIGFIFQSYNLLPTLPVSENVALPFRLRGERVDGALIEESLAAVGLAGRGAALPSSMSGGEQQRVAIARVLAQRPRIVFADEPTGALDTASGRAVLGELRRIGGAPGQCVLIVTHDPTVAAACDRIIFMRDGHLVDQLTATTADAVAAKLASLESRDDAGRAA